jgi:hypothetical protein
MLRFLTVALFCGAAFAQLANRPTNLDFRTGVFGDPPPGWLNPTGKQGFPASITDQCRDPGSRCAVLRSETVADPAPFGNLMQAVNAVPFRNKLIRFRAAVRVESSSGGRAQLWVRVDRPGGQMGFFDNMQQRPIVSSVWQEYEIKGEVAADATLLNFGLMLIGGGAAYLDAVSLDVVGEVKVSPAGERSRPLGGRGLENLTAFARLYAHFRYFHPGGEAARADWTAPAIAGLAAVENAPDPADLARRLQAFVRPWRPRAGVAAGRDEVLERALSLFN